MLEFQLTGCIRSLGAIVEFEKWGIGARITSQGNVSFNNDINFTATNVVRVL